ncbi:acyl-CoA N-acyltransferase [Phascolomyces articulosus]|uniref:Acyl-CoA N-acyltransferase n=1 Tax=Phascolomyces articulosus TaxID=60185 RepID=A0AAD5JUI0_9FUNG|nr:acyl-CoA N-acyltransferase [Phascolomyces articulosus]
MVQQTNNFHIREATVDDLKYTDDIVRVVNEAYQTGDGWTSPKHIVSEPRTNATEIKDLIERNGTTHVLYLALDGDEIVGTIMYEQPNDKGEAYCTLLAVAPTYQSRGAGGQLFRYMLEQMKNKGIPTATLTTFASRSDVISWYKKLGFVEESERVDFSFHYKDAKVKPTGDSDLVIMKRPLV